VRSLPTILLSATALVLQGCCGLFYALGCAPERAVSRVSFESPEASIRTFLTAVGSGDTRLAYECLGEDFKSRRGFDGLTFEVAWSRLKKEIPAIQALGEAEITSRRREADGSVAFILRTYGHDLSVRVARYAYWEAARILPPETEGGPMEIREVGAYVRNLDRILSAVEGERGRLALQLSDDELFGFDRKNLAWVKAGWTWRIRDLRVPGFTSRE